MNNWKDMVDLTEEQKLIVRYARSISNNILNTIREKDKRLEVEYFDFEKLDIVAFCKAMDLSVNSIIARARR